MVQTIAFSLIRRAASSTQALPLLFMVGGLLLAAGAAQAATWFAIMGNPRSTDVDTVELNVENVPRRGELARLDLRVNLARQRNMVDGEKYQSYLSLIEIDCAKDSVVHVHQTRYVNARWTGASTFQRFNDVRPMAFGGLLPSPKAAVLRAACNQHQPATK